MSTRVVDLPCGHYLELSEQLQILLAREGIISCHCIICGNDYDLIWHKDCDISVTIHDQREDSDSNSTSDLVSSEDRFGPRKVLFLVKRNIAVIEQVTVSLKDGEYKTNDLLNAISSLLEHYFVCDAITMSEVEDA